MKAIWTALKPTLVEAFGSKKFIVFLSTWIIVLGNRALSRLAPGYELDPTEVQLYVGAAGLYIVGQGIADHGKEAAQINATTAAAVMNNAGAPVILTPPKSAQAGFVRLGLLMVIAMLGAMLLFGCAKSTDLHAAYVTVSVAGDSKEAVEHAATEATVARDKTAGKTNAEVTADVAAIRALGDKFDGYYQTAIKAIAAAADAADNSKNAAVAPAVSNVVKSLDDIKASAGTGSGSGGQ